MCSDASPHHDDPATKRTTLHNARMTKMFSLSSNKPHNGRHCCLGETRPICEQNSILLSREKRWSFAVRCRWKRTGLISGFRSVLRPIGLKWGKCSSVKLAVWNRFFKCTSRIWLQVSCWRDVIAQTSWPRNTLGIANMWETAPQWTNTTNIWLIRCCGEVHCLAWSVE